MKLLLCPWFPYAGSVVIHALAWGACCLSAWCWFAYPELLVSHRRGDPLEMSVVMASAAAEPEPSELVETAVELAVDSSPTTTPTELPPQEVAPQRALADSPPLRDVLVTAEDVQPQTTAPPVNAPERHSDAPPPPKASPAQPIARQARPQQLNTSATVAVPFQPPRERGVVDALPQKLPASAEPRWPRAAWLAGVEGRVVLRVVVDAAGIAKIVEVSTSSGREDFDDAALTAVRQWRFSPARRFGSPVEHAVLVPIRFSLRRG